MLDFGLHMLLMLRLYILQEYKQNETIGFIPCTWHIAAILLLQKVVHSYIKSTYTQVRLAQFFF